MPLNSTVQALIRNRKYGVAIKHVTEKIRKTNPDVAQIFDELANGLNDVYRTMAQPTALQDLVIVDPSGRKIIELNPNGTITVQDASGHQVALLGDVVETPLAITAATAASPSVLTVPGNTYENGDTIEVIGALGTATRVTYRIVQDVGIAGSGTFTTTDLNGTPLAGSGAYAGGATATRYYGGLLAETIAIGESFADYKLRAFADGSLKIRNAEITLESAAGIIVLDPSIPDIKATSKVSGDSVDIEAGGINLVAGFDPNRNIGITPLQLVISGGSPGPKNTIDYQSITLTNALGTIIASLTGDILDLVDPSSGLESNFAPGTMFLTDGTSTLTISSGTISFGGFLTLTAPDASTIAANGTFDAQAYKVGGAPGITATIPLAKITAGGANGSITYTGGIPTAYTPPT